MYTFYGGFLYRTDFVVSPLITDSITVTNIHEQVKKARHVKKTNTFTKVHIPVGARICKTEICTVVSACEKFF